MKISLLTILTIFAHLISAQNKGYYSGLDTVFTRSGDTLTGKVSVDKDNNRFLFTSEQDSTRELFTANVKRFTYYIPENNGEIKVYIAIMHDFYFVEFGEKDPIRAYARYYYETVLDNGPKYHIVTKKYCFFKGRVPFFPKEASFKADMLLLMDDCPKVAQKIVDRDIKITEVVEYVLQYNNCNGKRRR